MKLNIGCGSDIREDYINIDRAKNPGVDVVFDLEELPYPFEDNSVDEIYASHILEHFQDPIAIIHELHRILKVGGQLRIKVPHPTNPGIFSVYHKSHFCLTDFYRMTDYDDPIELSADKIEKFKLKQLRINFLKGIHFHNYIIEPLANIHPQLYEHLFSGLFHAKEYDVIIIKKGDKLE